MKILETIKRNNYYKNITILASGTIISHIIFLVTLPIITRLYTPDMFGVLTIYMSIMGLISVISALKYELAIPNPKSNQKAYFLAILSFLILFVSIFIYFILGKLLTHFNLLQDKYNILYLVLIGIFFTMVYDILTFLNIREYKYKEITKTKITRSLSLSIGQISLSFFGISYYGLIIGEILGRFSGNIKLFQSIKDNLKKYIFRFNFSKLVIVAKEYKEYPLFTAPAWLINNSILHIIPLFIVYQYGVKIAGFYFMAYKVMSIPELILSQSVNQAFTGSFSEMLRKNNKNEAYTLFQNTVKKMFFFALIASPLLGLLLFYFFPLIFGEKWHISGTLSLYMIPLFISQFTMSSMYIALNLLGKQKIQFSWDIIRFLSILFLIMLTIFYKYSIEEFLLFYSIFIGFNYFLLYVIIKGNIE